MKFLDLFCCCGGISKGLHNAIPDAHIDGVDLKNDHDYPFGFIHEDVFDLDLDFLKEFDLIHASPPCQHNSCGSTKAKNRGKTYPDLVDATRDLLLKTGKPFTMENVIGAPLRKDLVLCGEMFGLRVLRHRIFEIHGFTVLQPPHLKHKQPLETGHSYYSSVAGHGGHGYTSTFENWKKDMAIEWVTKKNHLTQMIPPAYYEYIINSSPFKLVPNLTV